ncbi:flagellar biosynthesis protein FlhA [candidate division KSB1 bacterium]|nr:flagellar biosynthesis protein FlhA [candidate division KSB1 bacterium]
MAELALSQPSYKNSDIYLVIGVLAILTVMIIPLPTIILDLLLATNIAFSLLILVLSMYIHNPLNVSVFPSFLLIMTMFRLSLNIASTRLILGESYAGQIILAFGSFVIKGNYVVGLVIFIILIIIQFVVITKGAGRISEVAARFTLDAMPGKQMSIDADLNAGLIDEKQALARRQEISDEAEFYGAMDGASKFVRGDAIAGLIITTINILGGFAIGVFQMGMPFVQALQNYTTLTIGDGLVSQIPALLISIASGLIVSRAASGTNMGHELSQQLMTNPKVMFIVASVLFIFGLTPGLPKVPFFVLSAAMIVMGMNSRRVKQEEIERKQEIAEIEQASQQEEDKIENYLQVDPMEIEIGYGLIPLVDAEEGGDLLAKITTLRKQCAIEFGIIVPPIRIRDNLQLNLNQYVVKIRGNEIARNEIMTNSYMALNPGTVTREIDGVVTTEPAFGLPALWIGEERKEEAELAGYTVVEPTAIVTTHLKEIIRQNAHLILTRQDVQSLIDNIKGEHKTVVDELIPGQMSVGSVQRVLENLLKEGVPIRDLPIILETLSDYISVTKDFDVLTEYVRKALAQTIFQPYKTPDRVLRAITLDSRLEEALAESFTQARAQGTEMALSPEVIRKVYTQLSQKVDELLQQGETAIVACSPMVRPYFRKLIESVLPNVVVLSFAEIPPDIEIQSIAMIGM